VDGIKIGSLNLTKSIKRVKTAYQVLYLDMAYDGAKSAKLARTGLEGAEQIIKCERNETMLFEHHVCE
jgi:hypothetical protein